MSASYSSGELVPHPLPSLYCCSSAIYEAAQKNTKPRSTSQPASPIRRKKMACPAELYAEQTCSSNISSTPIDPVVSSPRISFSSDFLDDDDDDSFISISPSSSLDKEETCGDNNTDTKNVGDFEFLSNHNMSTPTTMLSADELFFEGKLLPYWQMHHAERLSKINLKSNGREHQGSAGVQKEIVGGQDQRAAPPSIRATMSKEEPRIWFTDDDPSPRPPKCTVLWKELLRLKKQRPHTSTLSPSSSSSSSSSSGSMGDAAAMEDGNGKEGGHESFKEKQMRRIKKGLERTKSATAIGIRPMVNVPVCHQTQRKSSSLPPLFPIKRGSAMVIQR